MTPANWSGMIELNEAFFEKLYHQVSKIPAGKVSTYGKIAELAGYPKASREAGIALSRVPEGSTLPCHRVVNRNGTLAPDYVFGSREQQMELLLSEGITFTSDRRINMERHIWPDDPQGEQMSLFL